MVPIGGGSTKFVFSNRWIVYTKSRKHLLHRKYLSFETVCIYFCSFTQIAILQSIILKTSPKPEGYASDWIEVQYADVFVEKLGSLGYHHIHSSLGLPSSHENKNKKNRRICLKVVIILTYFLASVSGRSSVRKQVLRIILMATRQSGRVYANIILIGHVESRPK